MRAFIFFALFITTTGCSNLFKTSYTPEEIQSESKKINIFFENEFQKFVKRKPMVITRLGGRERYHELDDISHRYAQEDLELTKKSLIRLKQFNYDALNPQSKLSYQLFKQELEKEIESFKYYYHHFFVSQMFGHHTQLPSFMINMHQIANEKEAQDYVSRLNKFEESFDQLIAEMKEQHRRGIYMPLFVFDQVIRDSKNIISYYPISKSKKENTLYRDFKQKLRKIKLSSKKKKALLSSARNALRTSVKPGYEKFISYMYKLKAKSPNNHGAWDLPQGNQYYKSRLAAITTTDMTAEEIHKVGLQEVARIRNEMRTIMKTVGFKGTLPQFFAFMKKNKKFYFPNTSKGRKAYLKKTNQVIDAITVKLDQIFNLKPKAKLKVKPVEAFREKSTGIAFYQSPALDGSRPGIYYVNLSDMSSVAKYNIEALAYHEAIPGHHMQLSIAQELKGLPKFRKFARYIAYIEGWGLYSEYAPKDLGLYKDPYSDFGRLSMEIWRACRLVLDTGIHHYKWSREKSIQYLIDNTPASQDKIVKGVERYFVMPAQATAYKVGQLKILSLRNKAKKELGPQFDIREFHDEILKRGALPLNILEEKISEYIYRKQKS